MPEFKICTLCIYEKKSTTTQFFPYILCKEFPGPNSGKSEKFFPSAWLCRHIHIERTNYNVVGTFLHCILCIYIYVYIFFFCVPFAVLRCGKSSNRVNKAYFCLQFYCGTWARGRLPNSFRKQLTDI